MSVISLTGDHLVPVGGSGTPTTVTVVSGAPVCYSTDLSQSVVKMIALEESVTFDHAVYMWSPTLSAVRVDEATSGTQAKLAEHSRLIGEYDRAIVELRGHQKPPETPNAFPAWQRALGAVSLACGPAALVLTFVH